MWQVLGQQYVVDNARLGCAVGVPLGYEYSGRNRTGNLMSQFAP
jgi:hypothetical protein